jgi:hypothetical protein
MAVRSLFIGLMTFALLASAGCGLIAPAKLISPPKLSPGSTVRANFGDQAVRIDAPFSSDVVAVALWFHGQGGNVDTRMNQEWLNVLRERGWAVASGDLGGNSWGDADAVRTARELERWATLVSGRPVKLVVAGSMGAATSLNAMVQGQVRTPCWYGTMPVFDLNSLLSVPGIDVDLQRVYPAGIPPLFNPADNALPPGTYRVISSDEDTKVPARSNADPLAARTAASVLKVTGDHGDPSHFDADDLAQFATECLEANPAGGK